MQTRKLYRSRANSVIGGVASGLAEYFNLDPLIVRILFVVMALVGGGGLVLYIALWIFVPENPDFTAYSFVNTEPMENEKDFNAGGDQGTQKPWHDPMRSRNNGNLIGGLILIALGVIFLADRFIPRIDFGDLWPILLIVVGIAILAGGLTKTKSE